MKIPSWARLKAGLDRFLGKTPLVGVLFILTLLFQVYLVTKLPVFYPILKTVFLLLIVLVLRSLARMPRRELASALLILLVIVAFRIPFYAHADGMMFTSDNALEALQPLEIQDSKRVPLYLLDSAGHNGTLKYLLVAFVWDFFGKDYLTFVLFQLMIFCGVCRLLFSVFRTLVHPRVLVLFLLSSFMFIEVIFDYSLFLRAAPYLETIFFVLLGISVFDWDFRRTGRLFLTAYFFLFAIYLHPLGVFFVVPFIVGALILAAIRGRFLPVLGFLAAGALAGAFPMLFFKLFGPPPQDPGAWFQIVFLNPADLTLARIPGLVGGLVRDFRKIFNGLFNFELTYALQFFKGQEGLKNLAIVINRVLVGTSFAVLLGGLAISVRRLIARPRTWTWSPLYFVLLTGTILGKLVLLSPHPLIEPRHNLDLAFLVILAFLFVSSEVVKIKRLISVKSAGILLLLLVFAAPHYVLLLKMTRFKEHSYAEIMGVLREHRIKVLNTDFIIAYPIYFFSDRRIYVTDVIGPLTIRFFYPRLRKDVEKVSWKKMAYLFFGDAHYRESWHVEWTDFIWIRLLHRLEIEKVAHRIIKLDYYTIVIPEPAMNVR